MGDKKKIGQAYKGNLHHEWEFVTADGTTERLRVPGGWLYATVRQVYSARERAYERIRFGHVLVPMPGVVKHKV